MLVTVQNGSCQFDVDLSGDHYGEDYWRSIAGGKYEPDTLSFLFRNLASDALFLDIGAANGPMSLIGACLGATVISFEPLPHMFRILERNVEINKNLRKKITLKNLAVSSFSGVINFSQNANPQVLSDIVFSVLTPEDRGQSVSVTTLQEELKQLDLEKFTKVVIKIDIEGGERALIFDQVTMSEFQRTKALVLLALHPGFHRPHRNKIVGTKTITFAIWKIRNFIDSYLIFKRLSRFASIRRTNLDLVTSAGKFSLLSVAGYFEFIINFGEQK